MKSVVVALVCLLLVVVSFIAGLFGNQTWMLMFGVCGMPFVFFGLGFTLARAGLSINISSNPSVGNRRSSPHKRSDSPFASDEI